MKTSVVAWSRFPQCDVEHELGVPLNCDERVGVTKVRIVLGADALLLFTDEMNDQSSSHSTSRTLTFTTLVAMMRSHFSPAKTRSFRMVGGWTSVRRSTLDTLLPSSRSFRTISVFLTGRYMPSSGFSWGR